VISQLERKHQHIFQDVSAKVGVTLRSKETCKKTMFRLCREILKKETGKRTKEIKRRKIEILRRRIVTTAAEDLPSHEECEMMSCKKNNAAAAAKDRIMDKVKCISWGRICSIVVVTANLAKESIEQDSAEMIPTIIDSCTEYVSSNDMEVPKWIERKGGWKQLLNVKDTTAVVTAVSTSPPSPKITVTSLRGNTSRMMSGRDQSTMIYFIFSAVVVFMTVIVSCVWYGKGLNHRPI